MRRRLARFPQLILSFIAMTACARANAPAEGTGSGLAAAFADNVLLLSVVFIFLAAIVGAIISARRRDRVLKSFDRFPATVVMVDGDRVWGRLQVHPNGLVLKFREAFRNASGHVVTSFIFYQSEYASIRAVLRRPEQLGATDARRRERARQRLFRPSVWQRSRRWLANQVSTLRDAILQAFALVVGQAKRAAGASGSLAGSLLNTQESRINQISGTVLGAVQLANDPILEARLGFQCIVELKEGEGWREIPGVLVDYTRDWLELWDAEWPTTRLLAVPAGGAEARCPHTGAVARRRQGRLEVRNEGSAAIDLSRLVLGGQSRRLGGRPLRPGEAWTTDAPADAEAAELELLEVALADVILPRAQAFVRHGAPRRELSWKETLGIGRKRAPTEADAED